MTKQQETERVLAMYDALPAEKKAQFDLMVNTVLNMLFVLFETSKTEKENDRA